MYPSDCRRVPWGQRRGRAVRPRRPRIGSLEPASEPAEERKTISDPVNRDSHDLGDLTEQQLPAPARRRPDGR